MDRSKSGSLETKKIKLWGIVQGVGFRPFVAKLAKAAGIKGEVRNLGGLVEIILTDTSENIDRFVDDLKRKKPVPAEIVHVSLEPLSLRQFKDFRILDSGYGDDEAAMIPADLAICPECQKELEDPANPRYRHPYISCMSCGPRYTIIDRLPYDRDNTAMADFDMCPLCAGEYRESNDRRYHAQTISCHDCGPYSIFKRMAAAGSGILAQDEPEQSPVAVSEKKDLPPDEKTATSAFDGRYFAENEAARMEAISLILRGGILALKATGGYNLVCSPFIDAAVRDLRRLKIREEKPFAVMFKDMAQLRRYCVAGEQEEELLLSSARPIVLLERIEEQDASCPLLPEVYKTSRFVGGFLPSMGIQHQLIDACGPLIMTSANLSDEPIIISDRKMQETLATQKDRMERQSGKSPDLAILYNKRDIRLRLDDSVVRIIDGQPQMIRRSKGYAPVPVHLAGGQLTKQDMVLAVGGHLKGSFCMTKGSFAYVSQYFGDLDSREAGDIYSAAVEQMKTLFRIEPKLIVCDLHPGYYTTGFAEAYAKQDIPLIRVQHHHAHVASVVAENALEGPVIGVSFDGTGYGTDGTIWGGEFLLCEGAGFKRAAHLSAIRMLGGDESMKEGWKSAMCYLHAFEIEDRRENSLKRDPRFAIVQAGLVHNINSIGSSSMGRLFDAIAAFLGIHDLNRYEGECAIMLENAAAEALRSGIPPVDMRFSIDKDGRISSKPIFERMNEGLAAGLSLEGMALGFHEAVAEMILTVCGVIRSDTGCRKTALTGGVFQNKILMEKTLALLRQEDFEVYYNISVGPNDGGICLGQAYLGMQHLLAVKGPSRK